MIRSSRPPAPAPAPARGELVIDSSDPEHVIATFNPLLLVAFARVPKPEEIDTILRRTQQAIALEIPGGLFYVVARKDIAGGVDPRVRAFFEDMIRNNESKTGPSAVVVLTDGFAAAMVRGAIAGLLSVFRQRHRLQVFANVEDAARWLAPLHEMHPDALLRAYRQATAHLPK